MHDATRKTKEDASERAFDLFVAAVGVGLRERDRRDDATLGDELGSMEK